MLPCARLSAQPVAASTLAISLLAEESYVELRSRPSGNGGEFVTRIMPSVNWASRSGRVQGTLGYSGSLLYRGGRDDGDGLEYLNSLAADLRLEAIARHGFVDARASISQQTVSATGQPVDSTLQSNDNRTEVRTVMLSPYLRGNITDALEYELRAAGNVTNTDSSSVADSHSEAASFFLRSTPLGGRLGWSLTGQRQRVEFSTAAAATTTDRVNLELAYPADIDWRFAINGGVEESDVIGGVRQRYDNYGASVQWTPSARTRVALRGDQRYFGRSHSVVIEHRLARSQLRYSDGRDVSNGADLTALATAAPSGDGSGFVVQGITVQRRKDLSWSWQAPRTGLTITAFRSGTERVDAGGVNPAGPNDDVSQSGYSGSLAYRLTPDTSMTGTGARTLSRSAAAGTNSDLKSLTLALTSQLGRRASAALSLRYAVHNSASDPYRESALSGSLSLRF